MDPIVSALIAVAACVGVFVVYMLAVSGGNMGRFMESRRLANRWLKDPTFAAKVDALGGPPVKPTPPKPSGEPLRLLALLQREGRLLDFLLEDIGAYPNEQI